MKKTLRNQGGFTLIELMIVVVIIGILAAIAIPNFLRYQLKSRSGEAPLNLKGIFTAQTAFGGKYNRYVIAGPSAAAAGSAAYVWNPANPENLGFTAMGFRINGSVRFCYSSADGTVVMVAAGHCGAPFAQSTFDATGNLINGSTNYRNSVQDITILASADLDGVNGPQTQSMTDESTVVAEFATALGEVSGEALF